MKILAVDYGDARTGLAVCDATETLASPMDMLVQKSMAKVAQGVADAAAERGAQLILLGLPLNMDGSEGARAQKSRKLGDMLRKLTDISIEYWDERNTTKSAQALLCDAGTFGKKRKSILDSVAAVVLLESYLNYRKNNPQK